MNGVAYCGTKVYDKEKRKGGEFDAMMQAGLDQARKGESVPYEDAFDSLMKGL